MKKIFFGLLLLVAVQGMAQSVAPMDSETNEFEVHQDSMLYLKTVKVTYTLTNAARIQQVVEQKSKEREALDTQWFELKQLHNKAVVKEKAIVKRKKQ